jgi:CRP-like cAMP-binding protein
VDSVEFLVTTPLFQGIGADEARGMLGCLGAREKVYEAGEYVLHMGETTRSLGVVIDGCVRAENVDVWGNVSIVGIFSRGDIFADMYAVIPDEPLMVNVVAAEPTRVMFLEAAKVVTTCPRACGYHNQVALNLNLISARKNLALTRRIFHAAPKSIRGKVLSYLSFTAAQIGSREFDIPFNRQQLADYLGVDRSALSAELSRMQKEGIIATRRSHFVLHDALD